MKKFWRNNGLSLVFFILFLLALVGQFLCGWEQYNQELQHLGSRAISWKTYWSSGHFLQATFENWESEFLQMGLFVWLTIFLKQKGSSESKGFQRGEPVDRKPSARRKGAPWPVRKGGWWLALYQHSLTVSLFLLFAFSFIVHFYGSLRDENLQAQLQREPTHTWLEYLGSSRLWFESFQNWQSEFLSVFSIIVLSIYLRQIGSSQSKPVDAPHEETGE